MIRTGHGRSRGSLRSISNFAELSTKSLLNGFNPAYLKRERNKEYVRFAEILYYKVLSKMQFKHLVILKEFTYLTLSIICSFPSSILFFTSGSSIL